MFLWEGGEGRYGRLFIFFSLGLFDCCFSDFFLGLRGEFFFFF